MAVSNDRPLRPVTRDDVARLAGVSSAVVSYVVNNGPRPVAEATRVRVQEAIDKLGYLPNAAARSLIKGRSDLLGLIVPNISNPYFAALARATETAARAQGVNLVLTQGTTGTMAPLVESLCGHLVAGVITATVPEPEADAVMLRNRVPVVKLSLVAPATNRAAIYPDYYGGAGAAVRHLIQTHGHRRIALVIGSDHPEHDEGPMDDRERGWRDELEHAGLSSAHLVRVPWAAAGGRQAAERLLAGHPDVTAVFVASDEIALGLISGLHRAGRSVPRDLAIVSFDGSPEADFSVPSLTTSSVPLAAMAKAAVRELLSPGSGTTGAFATELVVRESCGCNQPTGA